MKATALHVFSPIWYANYLLIFVEAIAVGLPVFATMTGVLRELYLLLMDIHGQAGNA